MSGLESKQRTEAERAKRLVALSSVAAAVLLTAVKIGVGLSTNSLGILSEAAHSALDLVAALITLWAVRISGRPADEDHTYGHGKVENLSALIETLLLLATCVWIISEACRRLFFAAEVHIDPNLWAFLVVLLSIVVDISRSRALKSAADKYASQALEADALHFSTDIWSSAVVLLGLIAVLAAELFDLPWLINADAVAALAVAVIVIWVSIELGKNAVDQLLDRIPADLQARVVAAVAGVAGVEEVKQVRLRRSGAEFFVDLTLTVGRAAAFEQVHEISSRVEGAVRELLPAADVVVHVEPVASPVEDVGSTVKVVAARHGVGAHGLRRYGEQEGEAIELHVEVDPSLNLEQAHQQVTHFEDELRQLLPNVERIVTHIEPAGRGDAVAEAPDQKNRIEQAIRTFFAVSHIDAQPHDLRAQWSGGELSVSLDLALAPGIPITEAHALTGRLEEHLRRKIPNLGRVTIHVEPPAAS